MKITTTKKIEPSLLGERVVNEYSYIDFKGESNDGMRRGYSYTVHCKVFSTIDKETRNQDGTYTYEYSSRVANDDYGGGPRNPSKSEYDLKTIIQELLFTYNIHEFSTDLQEELNNVKDYYAHIETTSTYQKEKDPSNTYDWSIKSKDSNEYVEIDNSETKIDVGYLVIKEKIKSASMEDVNKKINRGFSKEEYILYLMGYDVKRVYQIKLGLDDIGENETVDNFLERMKLESPQYKTFESALKGNVISMEDIKNFILKQNNLSVEEIPYDILEQLFSKDQELILHFNEKGMPIEILRKYNPNFDIRKVNVTDLISSDLDKVLEGVVNSYELSDTRQRQLILEYMDYLKTFLDNPEALRKIIPILSTTTNHSFKSKLADFISQISPEVLESSKVRDIVLEAKNIELYKLLQYQFNYDENSARKLMEIFSNVTSITSLDELNAVFDIAQQNGINNDEMLQALRENGFNISISDWEEDQEQILKFKNFKIDGITIDDLRDSILKYKNFNFLKLADDINSEDITREYNSLLNELAEKKGKKDGKDAKRYEEIFELMCNYQNASELFSRLTPDVKEITKKLMIEKLDIIEELQNKPIDYSSKFSKIMKTMTKSFVISEEDMTKIYMKCLNNGASKEKIISELQRFMPKEEGKRFAERINSANIYPNPKYFWLTDKNLKRIGVNRGEDRGTIKSKIQADGRCFSIKVKTDMVGESKDGKRIAVNNLSKWLFGVPGVRGNLTITRMGDCIQLPGNTPDEAVELIKSILKERTNEHSK